MRKYMAEFGLNVSTGYKTLIPVEALQEVNDGHNYHIYFILAPKYLLSQRVLVWKKNVSV